MPMKDTDWKCGLRAWFSSSFLLVIAIVARLLRFVLATVPGTRSYLSPGPHGSFSIIETSRAVIPGRDDSSTWTNWSPVKDITYSSHVAEKFRYGGSLPLGQAI
ncbi:uncharacterized protein ARMOST_21565 [Armillaria ostoyae]|uniref:Uncharacterized protein n=1 Tax=Armillaria ostoyae TaxID=47428 RepID=A0A284SAH2_ARMOS|nr:uncharacterized protein ARMOST_21565 [Armillaria ostoyae]